MKYSILQKKDDCYAPCEIIYDTSIDRAIKLMQPDLRHAEYFLSVLEKPLTDIENIKFRQEIFLDFLSDRELLPSLKTILNRYDKIRSDWQEMKLGDITSRASEISAEVMLEHTFSSLKITSMFPSTISSFFVSLSDILGRHDIKSEGLIAIRDRCKELENSSALSDIVEISQKFRYNTPDEFDFTVKANLDKALRLISCDLIKIEDHKETKGFKLFGNKAKNTTVSITNDICDSYSDSIRMLCQALSRIDTALTVIMSEIYDSFFGISSELMFYETALIYFDISKQSGVPITMPTILECHNESIEIKAMHELMLLANGNGSKTVSNNVCIKKETSGLLVKGLTDSGKTVFLRGIGEAVLFAQAGLPVLAEEAKISIRHGFFSHFSSAEEEFLKGDDAGRFDQEAKEIARIINSLTPHSLLLLNETFQTTSYKEGTESIGNILLFMPLLKTKYIFVTHLTRLFDFMKNENVILASTSDDEKNKYKIIV